jgi:hypothetical protein
MQRGEFITVRAYINKTENTEINNLMMHFKLLKKKSGKNQTQNE